MAAPAVFLLLVFLTGIAAQPPPPQPELISERPGYCPDRPDLNGSLPCTIDTNCTDTEKCCRYLPGAFCVTPVVPDFSAKLYVVGLPYTQEAGRLVTEAIKAAIGDAASFVWADIIHEGGCAEVHLRIKATGEHSAVDAAITKLETSGLLIPSLSSRPYNASSDESDCPVLYNYKAETYILGLRYEDSYKTIIENFVRARVGDIVQEWEVDAIAMGDCTLVFFSAVADSTQEQRLNAVLDELEAGPVNVTVPLFGTMTLRFSSQGDATCFAPPAVTNECGEGRSFCRSIKKCFSDSQRCDGKDDCGDGSDEADCPGASGDGDCRQNADYCQNGGTCEYSEYYGESICMCPHPFSGDRCEVDVCSKFGSSVCNSPQGTCIGDLYMDQICNCSAGYKGVFCEQTGRENLTDCQRQRRFNLFLLQALLRNVTPPGAFLNGKTVYQQLMELDYHTIEVSKCWDDSAPGRLGEYHSVCRYNTSNIQQEPDCVCTNGEGLENGYDYVNGDCRVYSGGDACNPNPCRMGEMCQPIFGGGYHCMPTANSTTDRPGHCPRWTYEAEVGIAIFECRYDVNCTSPRDKCCKVGSGYQCVEAEFGDENTTRPGDCPRWTREAEVGIAVYECRTDANCTSMPRTKCCQIGAGTQCVEPVYGVSHFNISLTIDGPWSDAYTNRNSSQFMDLMAALRTIIHGPGMLRGNKGFRVVEIRSGSIMLTLQITGPSDLGYSEIMDLLEDLKNQQFTLNDTVHTITNTAHVASGACARMNCGEGVCLNGTMGMKCLCPDTHLGMHCEEQDPCLQDVAICMNGGTCESWKVDEDDESFQYYCHCPTGFAGPTCQVSVCDTFSKTGPVCGEGTCVGDLFGGNLCSCPADRSGTFCENAGAETLTDCQRKARLSEHARALFQDGESVPGGITANELQRLLGMMGIDWLPLYECTQAGNFILSIESLSVHDLQQTSKMCVSAEGDEEEGCNSAVCQALTQYGSICQNGGRCVGNIYEQLCDCEGTGYHGAICNLPGEVMETPCMKKRNFALTTMQALNGSLSVGGFPASIVAQLVSSLVSQIGLEEIWVPECGPNGEPTGAVCEHKASNVSVKECYCVDENEQRVAGVVYPRCSAEPPMPPGPVSCNCSFGEKCLREPRSGVTVCACDPEEDGECRLPLWYCGGLANCSLDQKCVHENSFDASREAFMESRCVPMTVRNACDRQPCKHGGTCVAYGEDFDCECPGGFGGQFCETNLDVCSMLPETFCRRKCIGDLMVGVLCECPPGRAGLECQHPANTKCERQRALYNDVMGILKGTYSVKGYTQDEARNLARAVMATAQADVLPMRNCTADGSFVPVQCDVDIVTMKKTCHCVNVNGYPLSSNVMAYPGYPPCTAPFSPNLTAEILCQRMGSVCMNGGICVGNLLNGTMCRCPSSHGGIFCQEPAQVGYELYEPESLCEFARESYEVMRDMMSGQPAMIPALLQGVLQSLLFKAQDVPLAMVKAQCTEDGRFERVQCTYNLTTDQPVHCYCMGPKGVILSTVTDAPNRPRCGDVPRCPKLDACTLRCEHGLAHDLHGCEICRCRDPCEGECGQDPTVRCVVERREDCRRPNWDGPCTAAVCRKQKKPGMCPVSVAANVTSLAAMLDQTAATCNVTCLDDADCPADHKCCGLCGTTCVAPVEEKGCQAVRESALQRLGYLRRLHQLIMQSNMEWDALPAVLRMQLKNLADMNAIWVPVCDAEGFFLPTQCKTPVVNMTDMVTDDGGEAPGSMDDEGMMMDEFSDPMAMEDKMDDDSMCFCVDRFGMRIRGTGAESADEAMCEEKPGECPFLRPNGTRDNECDADYDCRGPLKCCEDGLGANMCVLPTPPTRPAQVVSADEVMSRICELTPSVCGLYGTCIANWTTHGRICSCNDGYYGPLCTSTEMPPQPLTTCQERYILVMQLMQDIQSTISDPETIVVLYPMCDEEGQFEATQCEMNLDGELTACYCVDRRGRRLPGTTVKPEDREKMKCAAMNPCAVGTPLHHLNGSLVRCMPGRAECAMGYHCEAGRFGDLFCCRDRPSKENECNMPPVPGYDCDFMDDKMDDEDDMDPTADQTEPKDKPDTGSDKDKDKKQEYMEERFMFNTRTGQCEAFDFKGCSRDGFNFKNRQSCEARCIRKEHGGRCPRISVPERAVCKDKCTNDDDCQDDQKCCQSNCGRRCVRALNDEEEQCEVGQPAMDVSGQPRTCSNTQACPDGFQCNNEVCCPQREEEVCKQPVVSGPCEAYIPRYFYNATAQRCEQFVYGGCSGNDNNFESMEECCNTCGGKGKCKEGVCPAVKPVLSTACKSRCQGDGDCPKNQICCASACGGRTCVIPKSPRDEEYKCRQRLTEHMRQKRLAADDGCFLKFMPRCAEDGSWQEQQCNDKLGICWCVTPRGNEIPGTRTFGVAQCQFVTDAMRQRADEDETSEDQDEKCEVCPNGEPVQCCPQELCLQVCAADPTAVCRINPCGGCRAEFFNAMNETVDCTAGLTQCQRERMAATRARHQHAIVAFAASEGTAADQMDMEDDEAATADYQVSYIQEDVALMCHLKPQSGNCKAYLPQWFYNVTSQRCEVFVYGMCGGNDNRFNSPEECYSQCNSYRNPCAAVRCGTGPCVLTYDTNCFHGPCNVSATCAPERPSSDKMKGVYVPECTREGSFAYRQCQDRFCWCVNATGVYNGGFTDQPDSLTCDENGPIGTSNLPTCPDGQSNPKPACVGGCRDAVCPGKPFARCVVDLCSDDCSVGFVDLSGNAVQCDTDDQEETCKAHLFDSSQAQCPAKTSCNGRAPSTCGMETQCDSVVCKNNPCAVCITDPCSGQVYFKDRLTNRRLNLNQCNRLMHKSCELRQCEVMALNDLAGANDTLLAMPVCERDGSYRALQTLEDGVEVCVDSFGEVLEERDPSKGCKKDPVVKVKFSLRYNGNFEQVARGKEDKIKEAFLEKVKPFGITEEMIISFTVRPGSIVIDAEIGQPEDTTSDFDLEAFTSLIQQQAASGELGIAVDGEELILVQDDSAVQVEPVTASQVQEPVTTPVPDPDDDALSSEAKIAIAVVCSVVGVVILGVLVYCCCCKQKSDKQADYIDATYDKPMESAPKGQSVAVTNNTYNMYDNVKPATGGAATNSGYVDDAVDEHYVQVRM